MNIEYTISEKDYVNGLMLSTKTFYKKVFILYIVVFSAIVTFIVGFQNLLDLIGAWYIGFVIVIAISFMFRFLFLPILFKKQYKNYTAIRKATLLSISDIGYNYKSSSGESNIKWCDLVRWKENDSSILIYFAPNLCHIVPKRLERDGFDIPYLCLLLKSNIGNAT